MAAVAAAQQNRPEAGVDTRAVVAVATREAVAVATVMEEADIAAVAVAIAAGADGRRAGARIQEPEDRRKPLVLWLLIFSAFRLPPSVSQYVFPISYSAS
jgi:hypothetical protein